MHIIFINVFNAEKWVFFCLQDSAFVQCSFIFMEKVQLVRIHFASIQFYFSSFPVPFFCSCVRLFLQSNISSISQIYYFNDKFFFWPRCCCCHCRCCNEFNVRMQFLAVSCYSINSFKLDSWHKLKIGKWINREEEVATAAAEKNSYRFCATIESLFIVLVMRKVFMQLPEMAE